MKALIGIILIVTAMGCSTEMYEHTMSHPHHTAPSHVVVSDYNHYDTCSHTYAPPHNYDALDCEYYVHGPTCCTWRVWQCDTTYCYYSDVCGWDLTEEVCYF